MKRLHLTTAPLCYNCKKHMYKHECILKLGGQCRDLCLLAPPTKEQTLLSAPTTRQQHSVLSAKLSAIGVVLERPVTATLSYMHAGISTSE